MKRILSVILALALIAATSITAFAQEYTPTQIDGVYQLGTADDLIWFANKVNNATVDNEDYKISAALTSDIDMTGYDWQPIGKSILDGNLYLVYGYEGTFDGQGYSVKGIDHTVTSEDSYVYSGFFGKVSGAVIKNLVVHGSFSASSQYNSGTVYIGGIAAYSEYYETVIENCGFVGSLYGSCPLQVQCGGIIGYCAAISIKNCFVSSSIECNDEASYKWLGSFVGRYNQNRNQTFENCYYNSDACPEVPESSKADDLEGVEGKTADEFKDGTVCGLLNAYLIAQNSDYESYQNGDYPSFKKPDTRGLKVSYSVAPTYTVTIPDTVTLGGTAEIKAENVVVNEGKQVEVALTGTNGSNNAFTVESAEGAVIEYTVTKDDANIAVGDTVLKFNSPDKFKFSGEYNGTVTFTVSVENAQ